MIPKWRFRSKSKGHRKTPTVDVTVKKKKKKKKKKKCHKIYSFALLVQKIDQVENEQLTQREKGFLGDLGPICHQFKDVMSIWYYSQNYTVAHKGGFFFCIPIYGIILKII